jgi:hypothetical protein
VLFLGTGCTAMPRDTHAANTAPLRARAWTLPACPSDAEVSSRALAPPIELAAGLLLDRLAAALAAAAARDRDGIAWSGTDARYLYFGSAKGTEIAAAPAGCIVVALVEPASTQPAGWCAVHDADPVGSPAFEAPCTPVGRRLLAAAGRDAPPAQQAADITLPQLYVEIRLRESRDGNAIRPEVAQLYYPRALQARRTRERDLAITLQLRLPEQTKGSNLFVLLRGLEPGKPRYEAADLAQSDMLWTVLPAYTGRKPAPADIGEGLGAVNVVTEIRETGDTNAFLQALAAAFAAARPALDNALQ